MITFVVLAVHGATGLAGSHPTTAAMFYGNPMQRIVDSSAGVWHAVFQCVTEFKGSKYDAEENAERLSYSAYDVPASMIYADAQRT